MQKLAQVNAQRRGTAAKLKGAKGQRAADLKRAIAELGELAIELDRPADAGNFDLLASIFGANAAARICRRGLA